MIRQKISQIVVNNVLAFIKPFASKRLARAIELLLKPCCVITVESVDFTDCDGGEYDLTIVLESSPNLLGIGEVEVKFVQGAVTTIVSGTLTGNIVTIIDVPLTTGAVTITPKLLLEADFSNNRGIYILTVPFADTVPAC